MKTSDKILIVEDERDTRFILNKLLTKNNFEVSTATNGKEALELIKTFSPKVILADWTMPVMDGLELCNIIKKDENFRMIFFIMLTARTSLRDRVTGLDVGADDFLIKPIENQELVARIRSGVRIFNLQNELKSIEHSKAVVELACTIGHKINNPLSSLNMSLLSLKEELNTKNYEHFADEFLVIEQSIKRIQSLVQDLIHLHNPQVVKYADDNNMIKLD